MKPIELYKRTVRDEIKWCVDLRPLGGGRTFFDSEQQAAAFKKSKENDFKMFNAQFALLDDRIKYDLLRAHEKLDGRSVTVLEAVEYYLQHFKPMVSVPMSKAVAEFLESKERSGKRPRYVRELKYTLGQFEEHVGSNTKCDLIKASDVEKWLHNGYDWSNRTKHGKLIDLQTFFGHAKKQKWVQHIPTDDVEKIHIEETPICIFTIEECRKLMKAAQDIYEEEKTRPEPKSSAIAYLTLCLFCGIRPEEVLRLAWDNVDLDKGIVRVEGYKSKTRKRRLVTIPANATQWLAMVKDHEGTMPLTNYQKRINDVREKAGIQWGHDICRHTAASMMVAKYGAATTSRELGHSEQVLFQNYRELVSTEYAELFFNIIPFENVC